MHFCPDCGALLTPTGKALVCGCGHAQEASSYTFVEREPVREHVQGIADHSEHPLATFDHVCTKCGFEKAQLVSKGIFVSDEDESLEYICGKCGHHDQEAGLKIT
jgi:DNA-directed RNA polymerase subunit M/transcription elongation factor TFIIS